MKFDKLEPLYLWLPKEELNIISSSLVEFSQEMHWKLDSSKDQNIFKKEFNKNYGFFLYELDYVMQELWELEWNFRMIDIKEICVFLFSEMIPPKKPIIMHAALNKCSKNYEDYEISIRAGISKQELDNVLNEFKEKVMS